MDAQLQVSFPRYVAGDAQGAPAANAGRSRRERLLVAGVALAVIQVFFLEYLLSARPVHLWSDAAGYHYPLQRAAFRALKEGHLPLWDSSIYCGITFVGNVQAAVLYPPAWLLYAVEWRLPALPFKAYEEFIFLHIWLGFVLGYLWLRGRAALLPSILGAAVFALGGYMMWLVLHPGMLAAMAWMPLAFWGVDEAADRANWRPLWKVAAAGALAFLAGYPAAWLVVCLMVMVYSLAGAGHWRTAARACLALAASVPLFLMQLLPALDARAFMLLEEKYGPGAYGWRALLEAYFFPNWFNFNPGHPTDFEPGCLYLYLGVPALFAIAWAIGRRRLRPYLQPVAGIAAALLLANPPQWLIDLVHRIPPLDNTLQPYNFYSGVAPMAALITAVGLNDFLKQRGRTPMPLVAAVAASVAAVAWALREIGIWQDGGHFATRGDCALQTATAAALFSICFWGIRQSSGPRKILLAAALLFAVAVDYRVYGAARWFSATPGDVDDEYPSYGIGGLDDDGYRAMEANRRFRVVSAHGEGPHPLQYRIYGLATPEGFDPFVTVQYRERIERWKPFRDNRLFETDVQNDDMMQGLGVRYVTARQDSPIDVWLRTSPKFRLIGRWFVFCHVFEYLEAKPAYRWEDGAAKPLAWVSGRRDFQVQSENGGRFVLLEQYMKGWRALVDGRPVNIQRWDGAFQAIQVPAGPHRVTFEFRPMSFAIGAGVSGLAWMCLLAVAWSGRTRPRGEVQT